MLPWSMKDFIPPSQWPPNSLDLNLAAYAVWGILQDRIYRNQINDMEELRQHIKEEWYYLDQRLIDSAIREWHKRLQSCIAAEMTEDISNIHCEHNCFASCFNAACLLDY